MDGPIVEPAEPEVVVEPAEPGQPAEPTDVPEVDPVVDPDAEPAEPAEPEKTFTQEELEAEMGKRLARQKRKLERELNPPEPPPLELDSKLDPKDFEKTEDYIEALAEEKAEAIVSHKEATAQATVTEDSYRAREEKAIEKYDDFEVVAYNPKVRITGEMAEIIKSSEIGPDLAYHLGSNPEEAFRISGLNPLLQAVELGKLEASISAKEPAKPGVTNLPDPIKPVGKGANPPPTYDTTDPRSVGDMTASEWIAADRKRRAAIYRKQGYK